LKVRAFDKDLLFDDEPGLAIILLRRSSRALITPVTCWKNANLSSQAFITPKKRFVNVAERSVGRPVWRNDLVYRTEVDPDHPGAIVLQGCQILISLIHRIFPWSLSLASIVGRLRFVGKSAAVASSYPISLVDVEEELLAFVPPIDPRALQSYQDAKDVEHCKGRVDIPSWSISLAKELTPIGLRRRALDSRCRPPTTTPREVGPKTEGLN
jgi:hypothetical protein